MIVLHIYPFVALLSAGFLAVVFYRQGRENPPITPAVGVRLGAVAGFLCFCMSAILSAVAVSMPDIRAKIHEQFVDSFHKVAASRPPDPQIQSLLDAINTPEGFALVLIFAGIALLVISLILGVLGGAVGGKIFEGRHRS